MPRPATPTSSKNSYSIPCRLPLRLIVSTDNKYSRRMLNESQRVMAADKLANMRREDTLKRGSKLPDPHKHGSGNGDVSFSQEQAAKLMKVGPEFASGAEN